MGLYKCGCTGLHDCQLGSIFISFDFEALDPAAFGSGAVDAPGAWEKCATAWARGAHHTLLRSRLARLSHQWQGRGVTGDELRPADHAYASDLDLFGTGSLFELLCTARTGIGRATLANWLLYPAQSEEVAKRQAAIGELREALDLQEEWASVKGGGMEHPATSVREWTNAPAIVFPFYSRALAITLPICLVIFSLFAGAGAVGHNTKWAVAVAAALEGLLAISLRKKTKLIAANLVVPLFELELLVPLLLRIEGLSFRLSIAQIAAVATRGLFRTSLKANRPIAGMGLVASPSTI